MQETPEPKRTAGRLTFRHGGVKALATGMPVPAVEPGLRAEQPTVVTLPGEVDVDLVGRHVNPRYEGHDADHDEQHSAHDSPFGEVHSRLSAGFLIIAIVVLTGSGRDGLVGTTSVRGRVPDANLTGVLFRKPPAATRKRESGENATRSTTIDAPRGCVARSPRARSHSLASAPVRKVASRRGEGFPVGERERHAQDATWCPSGRTVPAASSSPRPWSRPGEGPPQPGSSDLGPVLEASAVPSATRRRSSERRAAEPDRFPILPRPVADIQKRKACSNPAETIRSPLG